MSGAGQPISFAALSRDGALAVGDGYRAKLEELGGNGPIFLRAGKLSQDGFDWSGNERFLEELTDQVASKMGMPGDTVITTKGNSTGRTGYVSVGSPPFVYSPHLSYWRCIDHARVNPGFIRYWARGPEFRAQLDAMSHGTDMAPYLSLADQQRLVITLPEIRVQRRIASTLESLDDKIESNRRAINLEVELAIARLSSGESSIRVGDEATLTKGLSYKGSGLTNKANPAAIPLLNLGNFTTNGQLKYGSLKFYTGRYGPAHQLTTGELLIANTDLTQARELLGRGFLIPPPLAGAIHTHHTSAARFAKRPWLAMFLWAQLQTPQFRGRATGFATGTTVSALPPETVLDFDLRFSEDGEGSVVGVTPLLHHAWRLEAENDRLVRIRDTLLPDLLSGRIRVPEAGATIDDAL